MGIESSAFHQREIFTCLSNDTRVDTEWCAWYGFPSQVRQRLHPVLCSLLAVAASHFVRACNNRLQNEHAPILHSANVILSEQELLFSEQVIPHSAHAIPLIEHGTILHSAHVILLREHRLILHSAHVILSEHELLFSEQPIPHTARVILLRDQSTS